MIKDPKKLAQRMSILCILIGFIALAVGIHCNGNGAIHYCHSNGYCHCRTSMELQ